MSCPGHLEWVTTGPTEDDVDPDLFFCGYDCQAAHARQRWFDLILRGEPEGPAAIHFCYLCDDIWESEPTCDHHEAIRKAIEFWTGRDHGPRARADAEEGK